jgi:hypothetical protein
MFGVHQAKSEIPSTRANGRRRCPRTSSTGVQTTRVARQTRRNRSSAVTGSFRCTSRSPQNTKSNIPRSVSTS